MTTSVVGLCASCAWSRRVESARGSVFVRCDRSDVDARFRKYPALPVLRCEGYETQRGGEAGNAPA